MTGREIIATIQRRIGQCRINWQIDETCVHVWKAAQLQPCAYPDRLKKNSRLHLLGYGLASTTGGLLGGALPRADLTIDQLETLLTALITAPVTPATPGTTPDWDWLWPQLTDEHWEAVTTQQGWHLFPASAPHGPRINLQLDASFQLYLPLCAASPDTAALQQVLHSWLLLHKTRYPLLNAMSAADGSLGLGLRLPSGLLTPTLAIQSVRAVWSVLPQVAACRALLQPLVARHYAACILSTPFR